MTSGRSAAGRMEECSWQSGGVLAEWRSADRVEECWQSGVDHWSGLGRTLSLCGCSERGSALARPLKCCREEGSHHGRSQAGKEPPCPLTGKEGATTPTLRPGRTVMPAYSDCITQVVSKPRVPPPTMPGLPHLLIGSRSCMILLE